jgi:hypothetical protein
MSAQNKRNRLSGTLIEPNEYARDILSGMYEVLAAKSTDLARFIQEVKSFTQEVGLDYFSGLSSPDNEVRARTGLLLKRAGTNGIALLRSIWGLTAQWLDTSPANAETRREYLLLNYMVTKEQMGSAYKDYLEADDGLKALFFIDQILRHERIILAFMLTAHKNNVPLGELTGLGAAASEKYPEIIERLNQSFANFDLEQDPSLIGLIYAYFEVEKILNATGLNAQGVSVEMIVARMEEMDVMQKSQFAEPVDPRVKDPRYEAARKAFIELKRSEQRPN